MVNRRIVLDKFGSASLPYSDTLDDVKAVCAAFAAINPEKDGWFTGTVTFKVVDGCPVKLNEMKIVRSLAPEYSSSFVAPFGPFPD